MNASVFCFAAVGLLCAGPVSARPPAELTWESFDRVADYVRLKPADENYQKITWNDTVLKGQQRAQKEDKPLLLWLYFGDPRASC